MLLLPILAGLLLTLPVLPAGAGFFDGEDAGDVSAYLQQVEDPLPVGRAEEKTALDRLQELEDGTDDDTADGILLLLLLALR